jgi:uncharacterized protein (UPF0332 family)
MSTQPPFDWSTYLMLAESLAQKSDEASLRSAISRAYYYVFHLGLERAKRNGYKPKETEASHSQLWINYTGSPEPACAKLGEIANRLKLHRVRADYENVIPRLAELVPTVITDARDFASRLVSLAARFPNPDSVRASMRRPQF